MQSRMVFGAAFAASLFTAGAAGATPMEFIFNGAVTAVDGSFGEIGAGDLVDGRVIFDSADIPADSRRFDPSTGLFVSSPSFVEGVLRVQATPSDMQTFFSAPLFGSFILQTESSTEVAFSIVNSNSGGTRGFSVGFVDETGPLVDLSPNVVSPFTYTFENGDDEDLTSGTFLLSGGNIQFSVASAQLRFVPPPADPAPEPAAVGLLGLGLAGLWRMRRRRQS